LFDILFEFPGQPKILLYPLSWYLFLYLNDAWDTSKIYLSNRYYIDVLEAGYKSLLTFAAVAFLIQYPISRYWVAINALTITAGLLLWRFLLKSVVSRYQELWSDRTYLFIGERSLWDQTSKEIESLYGFVPKVDFLLPPVSGYEESWLKKFQESVEGKFGVIISYTSVNNAQLLKDIVNFQRDSVIDVLIVSRIAPLIKRFEVLDNPTLIRARESSLNLSGAFLKRFIDVLLSIMGLILTLPIFVITAMIIKFSDRGPILHTDRRVGKNGIEFTFPKFRSMIIGANSMRSEYLGLPDESIHERYKSDPRITIFGRFIRRWSIDELPQLWCVLIGTMSIVGPRPILLEEYDLVDPFHKQRFAAKPGLTGLWQVTGRKEVAWDDRMLRDLAYVENWTLWKDIVLIGQTIIAVIKGEGAY
jgi:exopolysaccharide biosynthesis polyprenyl glycosylphosphotransferase